MTGGAGYVGSHTCKALRRAGFIPVTFDNLCRGHRRAVRWGPFVDGQLEDRERIIEVLAQYRISAVMHFAGYAYVGESMHEPAMYFRNNVVNTLNLLEAMESARVSFLVFSSSCATYGAPTTIPIPEDEPQIPINPYGESKLAVERMLRWTSESSGLRWVALRYFNAAGADPDGEIGEEHEPETHLIPLALDAAFGERPTLEIFGTDYDTPDGTAIRDFVHVSDLAKAHVLALTGVMRDGSNLSLNLGTGEGHSVREVLECVSRLSGRVVPTESRPRRPGDPPVLIAAATQARKVLDWAPKNSDLENIVATALAWHRRLSGRNSPGS